MYIQRVFLFVIAIYSLPCVMCRVPCPYTILSESTKRTNKKESTYGTSTVLLLESMMVIAIIAVIGMRMSFVVVHVICIYTFCKAMKRWTMAS